MLLLLLWFRGRLLAGPHSLECAGRVRCTRRCVGPPGRGKSFQHVLFRKTCHGAAGPGVAKSSAEHLAMLSVHSMLVYTLAATIAPTDVSSTVGSSFPAEPALEEAGWMGRR